MIYSHKKNNEKIQHLMTSIIMYDMECKRESCQITAYIGSSIY